MYHVKYNTIALPAHLNRHHSYWLIVNDKGTTIAAYTDEGTAREYCGQLNDREKPLSVQV